jgi:hypothetical protein
MRTQPTLIAAILLVGAATLRAQAPVAAAAPSLVSTQRYLAGRFRLQLEHAVAKGAARPARQALVTFMRKEVLPYLAQEGAAVYPVVDSVVGTNGYATIAASFDQAAITRRVDRLQASIGAKDPAQFVGEAYALAALLDAYFEREQHLVQPMLRSDLSRKEIASLIAHVNAAVPDQHSGI